MVGYEVVRKLAEGSAAEVFLARTGSSAPVVLEVLRPELTTDFEIYGRFLDAAKDRQGLHHPNLLHRRRTSCGADGRLCVITEPVPGDHLGSVLLQRGCLRPDEAVRLMLPLCEAVEYLHGRGIIHGYLRPSNVFLSGGPSEPKPKLLETSLSLFRSTRSVPGPFPTVLVEPEYLSPERIRGQRADVASDVYGLGVLFYELLTGLPPFRSADPAETRRKHLEEAAPALPKGCERLTPVVHRCLAKDPARRFPSVAEMRQALAWYAQTPVGATPALPAPERAEDAIISADELIRDDAPGPRIGGYELEGRIGIGGMGQVFRARHARLGRKVALKVLKPELSRDPTHLRRFFDEGRAVNRVNHPHIVEIHDFVEELPSEGGRVYLVMELLEGQTVGALRNHCLVPIARGVHIIRQVCDALAAAHAVGVIHRDVKPDNIFLTTRDGRADYVKVVDFGIAKLRALDTQSRELTDAGVVLGTPMYMAPEQALGEADHRADIYAVGTVLYMLLAGNLPHAGQGGTGPLMKRLLTEPPRRLPELSVSGERIPVGLRDAVMRALAKDPRNRFQTMAELEAALAPFDDASSAPIVVGTPLPPVPARKTIRARWPFAVGLAAAASVASWFELRGRLAKPEQETATPTHVPTPSGAHAAEPEIEASPPTVRVGPGPRAHPTPKTKKHRR